MPLSSTIFNIDDKHIFIPVTCKGFHSGFGFLFQRYYTQNYHLISYRRHTKMYVKRKVNLFKFPKVPVSHEKIKNVKRKIFVMTIIYFFKHKNRLEVIFKGIFFNNI